MYFLLFFTFLKLKIIIFYLYYYLDNYLMHLWSKVTLKELAFFISNRIVISPLM